MRNTTWGAGFAALVLAAQLQAGGFWITLGNPEAHPGARAMNAVVTARPVGCHQPERAKLTAKAVGVVDGRRQTVPLKVAALDEPGMYALTRQWPSEGRWVVEIVAEKDGAVTTALLPVGSEGVDRLKAKHVHGRADAAEIQAMLGAGGATVAKR